MNDPIESFRDAMRKAGLDYAGPITFTVPGDKPHRFTSEGHKGKCCWYVLYPDAPIAGSFGCWSNGEKSEPWCHEGTNGKERSQAEWDAIRRKWREQSEARERERLEIQASARERATLQFESASPVESNPYLARKGVVPVGELRQQGDVLIVPLRDTNGTLHSLQFIAPEKRFGKEGDKRDKDFLWGGKRDACFFTIADDTKAALVICEGVSTGLSIYHATGLSVVCAMNCGNLMAVAKSLRAKYPEREIILAADHDQWTEKPKKNPGLTDAAEAASAIGAKLAVPVFDDLDEKPTDFNDLARLQGVDAVKTIIERANFTEDEPGTDAVVAGAMAVAASELSQRYGEPLFFKDKAVSGLNERFFAGHFSTAKKILFEPGERAFYEYENKSGLWRHVTEDAVREMVSSHLLSYGRTQKLSLESKITAAKVGAIIQALRGITERRNAFERTGDFVHVENGVIRFSPDGNVELGDFRPEDYSRNKCPIPFDPNADCPQFKNKLLGQALSAEDVDLLQRMCGLVVASRNPSQRLGILEGFSGTGKSTIVSIIKKIVGGENCCQLRTDQLTTRFELARYIGRTLLLASDVPGNFLNRRGAPVLKSLVGGDPLDAEAKGSNNVFPITGNFNVLITSNSHLRVRLDGDEGAWRRRLIILRFEKELAGPRIPNFADKLVAEEGSGILRWALAGYVTAREEITESGDLVLTKKQLARVDALLSESNSLKRFIIECTEEGGGDVSSEELTEGYFRFCSEMDWTPLPAMEVKKSMTDLMLEHYGVSQSNDIKRIDKKQIRGWRGVSLKSVEPSRNREPEPASLER